MVSDETQWTSILWKAEFSYTPDEKILQQKLENTRVADKWINDILQLLNQIDTLYLNRSEEFNIFIFILYT